MPISSPNPNASQLTEAEICMILDTYMYLDYQEAPDGASLCEVIESLEGHPEYGGGGRYYGEYTILKQATENEAIGSLIIDYQSQNMGYDAGTAACIFHTPDKETVYVTYRGTVDGEWPDNGVGMTESATTQQRKALDYFENVVESMDISEEQRLIITGHSKGGNKAQYVTMETKYKERIQACYSVDGQGFSEKAIEQWKEKYSQQEYEERTGKIKGIHGENDYVSALGISIIGAGNIRYIKTPMEKSSFPAYHDIKYMFATLCYDPDTKKYSTVFKGEKNAYTSKRGELGNFAAALSAGMMGLEPEDRDGCAAVIMQVMESRAGTKIGINGEKLGLSDIADFSIQGIPLILETLFKGEAGKRLLASLFGKKSLLGRLHENLELEVRSTAVVDYGETLFEIAYTMKNLEENLRRDIRRIPFCMMGSNTIYNQMKLSTDVIAQQRNQLNKIAERLKQTGYDYKKWDEEAVNLISIPD